MIARPHLFTALALAGALVLLSACRTPAPDGGADEPEWVSLAGRRARAGQFISAVGSAPAGHPDPVTAADRDARQELATLVSEYVSDRLHEFFAAEGSSMAGAGADPFRRTLASEVAAATLRMTERKETWREPDGPTHVLYQVPADELDALIERHARALLTHHNPFEVAAGEVTAALGPFLAEPQAPPRPTDRPDPADEMPRAGPPAEDAAPAWLESPPVDRFPPDRYLTAVGIGSTVARAESDGRTELAGRVNAAVLTVLRTGRDGQTSVPPGNVAALQPEEARFRADDLPGTRALSHWLDPATQQHYVLVALDRMAAASTVEEPLQGALARHRAALAEGRRAEEAGEFVRAFKQNARALQEARRAALLQARALALAPPPERSRIAQLITEPILSPAEERLRTLARGLEMGKEQGDEQRLQPDATASEPFVVTVTHADSGRPVAGLPVRLTSPPPARLVVGRAVTDESGRAAWRAGPALPRRSLHGAVVAEVDLTTLTPGLDVPDLPAPSVTFSYVFRSPQSTAFLVTLQGGAAATEAASEVRRALTAAGFRPLGPEEAPVLEAGGSDGAEFVELARKLADSRALLVVTGTVESRITEETQTSEGALIIAQCSFSIRVLEPGQPEGRRLIAEFSGAGRASCLDDAAEAIRRARADARSRLADQLLQVLREQFPGM